MVITFIQGVERWCVSWKEDMKSLVLWLVRLVHGGKIIANANILSNKTIANFLLKEFNWLFLELYSTNNLLLLGVMRLLEGVSSSSWNNKWNADSGAGFLFNSLVNASSIFPEVNKVWLNAVCKSRCPGKAYILVWFVRWVGFKYCKQVIKEMPSHEFIFQLHFVLLQRNVKNFSVLIVVNLRPILLESLVLGLLINGQWVTVQLLCELKFKRNAKILWLMS